MKPMTERPDLTQAIEAARSARRWARLAVGGGALAGATGIAAGAFGAHALRGQLAPELLAAFETGARFAQVHGAALLAGSWLVRVWPGALVRWAIGLLLAGTALFSGSLMALALSGERLWGAVTPVGGTLLLAGWLALALTALLATGD
jgi:uncharacterized membrane protein YgdD (TMEM256/DUF423 family)